MTRTLIPFKMTVQPDYVTCGPSALHAVYRFWGREQPLQGVIGQVQSVPGGGTAAVMLALHAQAFGFDSTIYTCSLPMFDPSWFLPGAPPMRDRLLEQARLKQLEPKSQMVSRAYVDYLDRGGNVRMEDLTVSLLAEHLEAGTPLIMGLSATWLYRCMRDRQQDMMRDDIAGEPTGHFVVVHGIDTAARKAWVADPFCHKPWPGSHHYEVDADRLIASMLLGVATYDAKLLVIKPRS
ncbi:MAG: hypothetical protein WD768_16785 [Phycisphaeraceae bacterium]